MVRERARRRPATPDAPPPAAERSSGFSLVEVTIAIVVLTVLSFTTALVLVPVSREHRAAREMDLANASVRSVLESIHATPFSEIVTRYPNGTEWTVEDLPEGQIEISYEDPTADPLRVQLDLSWNSPDQGAMQRSFFTIRTE